MQQSYVIKKMNTIKDNVWDTIPKLTIDNFPWDENNYRPKTTVKIFYTDSAFHLFFKTFEDEIRAENTQLNSPVCEDSCMEFFFNANPEADDRYMNIEMNPIGTFLLGFGKDRYERSNIKDIDSEIFNIKTSVKSADSYNGNFWTLEYKIPFSFLEKYYGPLDFKAGKKMKGNVYKCGNETAFPHYGCWNKIENEQPDFHRPECFGQFILE